MPEQNVTFSAGGRRSIAFLPFLGQVQKVPATFAGGKLFCKLPPIEKGAVVWLE
jgi:hypothetical protein